MFTGKSETAVLAKASLVGAGGMGKMWGVDEPGECASCLMAVVAAAAARAAGEFMATGKTDLDVVVTSVVDAFEEDRDEHLIGACLADTGDSAAAEMSADDNEDSGNGDDDEEGIGDGDLSVFLVLWKLIKTASLELSATQKTHTKKYKIPCL